MEELAPNERHRTDAMNQPRVCLNLPSDEPRCAVLNFEPLPPDTEFKVLFVYPNIQRVRTPQLGIAVLSACLKRIGAQTRLFDSTELTRGSELEAFQQAVEEYQPDLVAYSVRFNEWSLTTELAAYGKARGLTQIMGGPHATHAPEEAIDHADAIVVGEGEGAIMDIVRHLATGKPLAGIPNTWVNTNAGVVKTPKRDLIPDLDLVPLPDWRLFANLHYQKSYIAAMMRVKLVAAIEGSRGCPFTCTYCSNESLMSSYAGQGKWRREKSPARIVEELRTFREEFEGLDFVYWVDEIWLTGVQRLRHLRDLYKAEIGVPFSIMERPECVTEEKIEIGGDAGLHFIAIGLESGDEELRTKLLNRHTKVASLVEAFTLPKKYGIKVHAFAMLGLPGQGTASMLKTWRFLRRIMPDTAQFSIFYPLEGTRLYEQTIQMGLYNPANTAENYYSGSVLKQDGIDDRLLLRYQRLFQLYATKKGIRPVIAFHLYRTLGPAYRLRHELAPRIAAQLACDWQRLKNLRRCGPREALRKILRNLIELPTTLVSRVAGAGRS